MKILKTLTFVNLGLRAFLMVVSLALLSPSSLPVASAQHKIEQHVDRGKYSYYTVTNDKSGVRVYKLKNGLTVYLARNTDEPRIRSMIAVRAGSAFDPPDNSGLAHYLEHLLFKGTQRIGSLDWSKEKPLLDQIESLYEKHKSEKSKDKRNATYREIDRLSVLAAKFATPGEYRRLATSLGAVAVNGYTEYDLTGYWCLIPSSSLEKHLLLERERFFSRPALRAFQSELEIVYEEFNGLQDSIWRRKQQALNQLIYQKHPYGQQTMIGSAVHLKSPSLKAIRSYFDTYYVPGNMAIVLVGDLEFDKTIRLVDQHFGNVKAKEVKRPALPKESKITKTRTATIHSSGEESIYFGFRLKGAGSRQEKLAMLTDMLLNNGFAGLFDVELNAKQAVRRAGCTVVARNDYSVHYFEGYPKEGQSLDEVRDRMLEQIARIKRGDFEEWLITGAVNDLKKQLTTNHSTSINLSAQCMHSFKRGENWADHLSFVEELGKISKRDVADFVRRHYDNNYSIVYIRKGKANLTRVDKPHITARPLNTESKSEFAEKLDKITPPIGKPQFVDFDQAIANSRTKQGVEVSFVENKKSNLFELDVIFDIGKDHDKKIHLAANYCTRLGTNRYSLGQLKSKLYQLGLTLTCYSTNDQTVFHLEGLEENLETGIVLLDHFMSNMVANEKAYSDYVGKLLKERQATLVDSRAIINRGLLSYALYEKQSSLRNVLSTKELKTTRPTQLVKLVKGLRNYKHRIFFFGSSLKKVVTLLDKHYTAKPTRNTPPLTRFKKRATSQSVYFVDVDTVQAKAIVVARGNVFDVNRVGPSNFFGPYFDHIAYRQLRNARSLAYRTNAAHLMAGRINDYDFTYVSADLQADKLTEALGEMIKMMKEVPGTANDVKYIRADQLKRYQTERLTGKEIFWRAESLRKKKIDHDIRRDQYAAVQAMTMKKVTQFFDENIKGRKMSILVVGSKKHIDMKTLKSFGEVIEVEPKLLFNY